MAVLADDLAVRRIMARAAKLTGEQQRQLHREVSRLVEPHYRELYREKWEATYRLGRRR